MQSDCTPDDDAARDGPPAYTPTKGDRSQSTIEVSDPDAQSAIAAITEQLEQLKRVIPPGEHPRLAEEQLIRWEKRTETVLEQTVGAEAAREFLDRGSFRNSSVPHLDQAIEAKGMFLLALLEDLSRHPETVFEQQARAKRVTPASSSNSVDELQERLVAVLERLKENVSGEARRYGRFISRVIGIALMLLVLSIVLLLLKPLMANWNTIEPIAWAVALVVSIMAGWGVRIPAISSIVEKTATKWRFNRLSRLIDFDATAAIIRGPSSTSSDSKDHS